MPAVTDYAPLRALLSDAGYEFVEPAIIHDSSVFVDLAGEDLRRRLYLTSDVEGSELALRPDYTIPVCLRHLTIGDHRRRADYAYLGPVFRQRGAVPGEFLQAGVESLGRSDRLAADASVFLLALEAAACVGMRRPRAVIGDAAPFHALVEALKISAPWKRRLMRAFGDERLMRDVIAAARGGTRMAYGKELKALSRSSKATVRREAQRRLEESGLATIGGRQADEIAARFLEKAELTTGIGARKANTLQKYLDIRTHPHEAIGAIRDLAKQAKVDIGPALDRFEKRIAAFDKRGVPLDQTIFSAGFGRRLDYYTGFNFEIYARARDTRPTIGGGRYDRLMSMLGAERAIPAIGFAIWLERTSVKAGA